MEFFGIIILIINVLIIGFVVWTVSSINEKLDLLIRIQLKKDDLHFIDKEMEEEIDKYRDK
jgi:low affinity Fe/Cu permease